MKILFTGGGTGGSVAPLIAVYQQLIKKLDPTHTQFFWIGGKPAKGEQTTVEKKMVSAYNMTYYAISAGKFRRYFSFRNFTDPCRMIAGFFQSLKILYKIKPKVIVTAGSFISVPVVWAAVLLRIPILVHHQDLQPGLANKLMAVWAKKITVSWQDSLKDFPKYKTVYTGNPVREEVFVTPSIEELQNTYGVDKSLPTLLIMGGGTGAVAFNKVVADNFAELVNVANIFHITGSNKQVEIPADVPNVNRYHQFEFAGEKIFEMMKLSDVVITRGGMGTLSELAVLGKASLIVPIPGHQEKNAHILYRNNAAIVYEQKYLDSEDFINTIKDLLNNSAKRDNLSLNIKKMMPSDSAKKVAEITLSLINK